MRIKSLFTRILICITLVLIISAHGLYAAPPKYPQSFNLLSGEQTSFGFPLTRAGQVLAEVQWQGGMGLVVSLVDMSGRTVATLNNTPSPARLSYNATANDLAGGLLWNITVIYPNNGSTAAASGSVSVRYPEPDPIQLSNLEKLLSTRTRTSFTQTDSMPEAHKVRVMKALSELEQSNQLRIQQYKTQADTQYASVMRSGTTTMMQSATKVFPAAMQSQAPLIRSSAFLTSAQLNTAIINKLPMLIEAVPSQAGPGQQVTLYGRYFTVQNNMYLAAFTVRGAYMRYESTNNPNKPVNVVEVPPLVLTVPVESITQLPDGRQQLLVHAPIPPDGSNLSPYDGDVSLKSSSFSSNIVPFQYQVSIPVLQSINPYWTKADEQATINGSQLASTDILHMVLNDGQDRIVPFTLLSPNEIRFTVPQYSSRTPFSAKVYVTRVVNGVKVLSREVYCMLWNTDLDITSLNVTQAPMDAPIIISGVNIEADPVVEFQVGNGMVYSGTVTKSSQTAIYVNVPKIGGVAVETPCNVRVKCGNKKSATTLTFKYIPTYVHEAFRFCFSPFMLDVLFGEPLTDMYEGGGTGINCGYGMFCAKPGMFKAGETFITAHHDTTQNWYFGKSGYDDYFPRTQLKNGWKLENAVVTVDTRSRGHVGAYLTDNGIGTTSPRARVRWWGDAWGEIIYNVTFFVTGPYGTSYY